jgi:hypothetical protein
MRLSREQRRALNPTANAASPTCNRGCDQTRRLPQDRLITMGKELAMVENNDRGRTFAGSRFEPGRIFGSVNIRTRHGFNQYPTYAGTGPAYLRLRSRQTRSCPCRLSNGSYLVSF